MEGSFANTGAERLKGLLRGGTLARLRKIASNRMFLFAIGPALLAVGALIYFGLNAGKISTDDASVSIARVAISPQVGGRIVEINVHENQFVHAGDPLFRLDDSDYRNALIDAEARLSSARLQVASLQANYQESVAQAAAADATRRYAQEELNRQRTLLRGGVASRQDVAAAVRDAEVAARQAAAAVQARVSAQANLGIQHVTAANHPLILQAQAALDRARDDLDHSVIVAPRDGVVAHVDQIQIGSSVEPAQSLFWLLSGAPWVDAAFKENQLRDLRPGQPARVRIDAYSNRRFHGHVVSLSPGTGSSFSVLPQQNATGNWVKVVQRVSVRIALDDVPDDVALASGLSASVVVDTHAPVQAVSTPLPPAAEDAPPAALAGADQSLRGREP